VSSRHHVDVFAARLHQVYRLPLQGGGTLSLQLIEVRDLGTRQQDGGALSTYALTFRSAGEMRHAPQGTYRIEHDELGTLEVFLVPLGPDAVGMRYEAIFN
jgi:hypothetical protein